MMVKLLFLHVQCRAVTYFGEWGEHNFKSEDVEVCSKVSQFLVLIFQSSLSLVFFILFVLFIPHICVNVGH